MLLSKEVEFTIVSSLLYKYLDLGYEVPQRPSKNNSNRMVYILPFKTKIKVEDLPYYSNVKVEVLCDYCKENICHPTYSNYNKVISTTGGTYACLDCTNYKRQQNNKEKYGVEFTAQLPEIKQKILENNMKNTGYSCALANPKKREQARQTMKIKYGAEVPIQAPEIKQRIYATNVARYGVEHPLQDEEIKKRAEETCRERFGTPYPSSTEEIKEKIRRTCNEKWGTDSYFATEKFREKAANSFYINNSQIVSRQQKYISILYQGILNYPCGKYNLDILVDNFDIEIDFGGHDLCVKKGIMSQEEFDIKEIIRNKYVISQGYKVVRIISRKDYLPSDQTLLQMLQYARDFFVQNPKRTWLSFDIDKSCIYNAYHKETDINNILYYDYGELHKIKNSDINSISL